uniref:HNHc domain-containing protein n=1 Tax=Rhabditophanes sp. KR3021 TaxID=114890 RepID=A0AC35UBG0_9BILA
MKDEGSEIKLGNLDSTNPEDDVVGEALDDSSIVVEWRRTNWNGADQNYEVYNFGNVRNWFTRRPLRPATTHMDVLLYCLAFILNPENKPQIDHMNRNKKDHYVGNLGWVTSRENNLSGITREMVQISGDVDNIIYDLNPLDNKQDYRLLHQSCGYSYGF